MLKGLNAAVMGVGLLLSATPAYCYTITELGTLTGNTGNDSRSFKQQDSMGEIEDYYTFSVSNKVNISASVTNSFSTTAQYINDFTIQLFSGLPPVETNFVAFAMSNPIASGTTTDPNDPPDSERAKLSALGQLAGNYYLKVTGNTADSPSYSGSLAVSISTVPLPASAPMFGAALLALGAVGYGVKRKKANAAA